MTKSLDLQTIPGEINEEIFIITALHYTYNNFPIEYNIQRKLLKWLTWGQIVKSIYLNVWFAKLLHGFLKCESHSSGLLQSYHLSRSIIDIAKEICSGGFPKAYSIDVKIEEL